MPARKKGAPTIAPRDATAARHHGARGVNRGNVTLDNPGTPAEIERARSGNVSAPREFDAAGPINDDHEFRDELTAGMGAAAAPRRDRFSEGVREVAEAIAESGRNMTASVERRTRKIRRGRS